MKKLYFTLAAIFVSSLVMAQETTTKNYVKSTTYQVSTSTGSVTNDEKIETITYYDGLGRPEQSRVKQGGGGKEDIISPIVYDGFGRQAKQYLPYSDTGTSSLYYKTTSTLISDIESYYITNFPSDINSSTPNPYSESGYDGSPLNRTLQQAAPGNDWKIGSGGEIDFVYETNILDEVKHYTVSLSFANDIYTPTLVLSGSYVINELFKVITKDENHDGTSASDHTTEEFKDKQGRVILRRTFNNETKHDTYYVYDDYGNLTYVLPPKSEPNTALPNSTELDELCYQYKYDVRNRLIKKKVPGKEWESMVYNKLDQPILTQDQVLKNNNKWLFTKYDAFGRVAYTGLDSLNTVSRTTMQTSANATSLQSVTRTASANTNGGTSMYYNNDAYPSSYDEVHTINYYDTYVDLPAGLGNTVTTSFGLTSTTDTQSLPTVSKVRVLSTNNWITTVSYYDSKGRPIYVYTTNPYLGTTDIIESDLDFTGKPEQIKTTHTKGATTTTTLELFTYDHAGRVTKQTHKINSGNEEVIAQNTYDGLGQLKNKKVGNTVANPLQTIDYTYNVRGWLKQINNPASLGSDLFAYKLNYNTVNHSGTKLYNGNIAETEWKTASDNTLRWYRYGYDDLNRISSAINNSSNYNLSSVGYDKNGNITNLTRRGQLNSGATSFGNMDVLVYTYQQNGISNQLEKVLDNGNDTYGFKDGVNQTIEYTYDNNGNLTTDDNKGITSITYNHLNLPTQINFGSSNKIEYFYDALGIKLKKKVTENSTITTTDYANGFIYENSALQFFNTSEGYVEPSGTNFDYIYQFKDHLDNIRLSYHNTGSINNPSLVIIEEHNYYPFGLKHKGYNATINGTHHKYMFGSKEYDESFQSLNTYDFGARNYDPALGRWMNIDPLAEQMRRHSPYNYAFNNPIFFIDPDGMAPTSPTAVLFGGGTITQQDVENSSFGFQQITGAMSAVVSSGAPDPEKKNGKKYQQYFRSVSAQIETETGTPSQITNGNGFFNGIGDGFSDGSIALGTGIAAGVEDTWSFMKSLATKEGWKDLGQGFKNLGNLSCQLCPEGIFARSIITNNAINYIGNISNMQAKEVVFDLGYGLEKIGEIIVTRRVIPLAKSSFGFKTLGRASRFTTIQSFSTYGKWGKFSSRKFTIPWSYTIDKATFYNRNFIIPGGRAITIGQFQYIQKN